MNRYASLALCFVLLITAGCSPASARPTGTGSAALTQTQTHTKQETAGSGTAPKSVSPSPDEWTENGVQATITMEDGGVIILTLYPDLAPQSVYNFVSLARQGYYDGLKFHRIMKGFMIQGGDPAGTGSGGPGYTIKGEFSENGFTNDLKHVRGVLSMARRNDFDSAGSQFFIMHGDNPGLDGKYAAFGKVVEGMDIVDQLADTPNSGDNGAVADENKPVIRSIVIDDDREFPLPDMIK